MTSRTLGHWAGGGTAVLIALAIFHVPGAQAQSRTGMARSRSTGT